MSPVAAAMLVSDGYNRAMNIRPFLDTRPVLGERVYVDPAAHIIGDVVLGEVGIEGLKLDEEKEDQIVSAYVVEALGRLARQGDRVRCGAWDITVEVARRRRVRRVRFTRRPESIKPDEPEG